jgi:hypothetical protein
MAIGKRGEVFVCRGVSFFPYKEENREKIKREREIHTHTRDRKSPCSCYKKNTNTEKEKERFQNTAREKNSFE